MRVQASRHWLAVLTHAAQSISYRLVVERMAALKFTDEEVREATGLRLDERGQGISFGRGAEIEARSVTVGPSVPMASPWLCGSWLRLSIAMTNRSCVSPFIAAPIAAARSVMSSA